MHSQCDKIMSENKVTVFKSELISEKATDVLALISVFIVFLLPLKFGMMTGVPEVSFACPSRPVDFIVMTWPPMFFSVFSALLLLGVLFCGSPVEYSKENRMLFPLSFVFLFLSILPGIVNASTFDFTIIQASVFAGYAAFALVLYRLISLRPEIKLWLINAVVLSTVISAFMGLHQYLYGFRTTLDYIQQQEKESGCKVSADLMSRLLQTRVFAPFSICNSLAAHLILTFPICLWGIYYSRIVAKSILLLIGVIIIFAVLPPATPGWLFFLIVFSVCLVLGMLMFRAPDKVWRYLSWLLIIVIAGILLFVLRHTYSRGAFLSLGLALFFALLISPFKLRYKVLFAILTVAGSFVMLRTDIAERSLASMTVRFDYYAAAFKMFLQHPFLGTGWGDFFHEYTKIKTFPGDETPHTPHNFILNFASQAGIFALFSSLLVLLTPFYLFFRKFKAKGSGAAQGEKGEHLFNIAVIAGWAAWGIHSLIDLNIQVPGSVATAITMVLIMNASKSERVLSDDESEPPRERSVFMFVLWYGAGPLVALVALTLSIHQLRFDNVLSSYSYAADLSAVKHKTSIPVTNETLEMLLNKCNSLAPYSPIPWMKAAAYAERRSQWGKAEMYLKEALKKSPERASLYFRLAIAQNHLGKDAESDFNLKKAAELFPNAYQEKYKEQLRR